MEKDTVYFRGQTDISSYMLYANLACNFEPFELSVNTDLLSGTKEASTYKYYTDYKEFNTFDNPYSTRHSIFGYMDYFNDIRKSTKNLGVNDYFLRIIYTPKSPYYGQLDLHYFSTNQPYSMPDNSLKSDLGIELDFVFRYIFMKDVSVEWGGGIFSQGDAMKEIYKVTVKDVVYYRDKMCYWSYLMLRASIF